MDLILCYIIVDFDGFGAVVGFIYFYLGSCFLLIGGCYFIVKEFLVFYWDEFVIIECCFVSLE